MAGNGVMADGLNSYLEEGEAGEPGWEVMNQKAITARSGGLTVGSGQDPTHLLHGSQRMCTERDCVLSVSVEWGSEALGPRDGTAQGVDNNTRKGLLGAPGP